MSLTTYGWDCVRGREGPPSAAPPGPGAPARLPRGPPTVSGIPTQGRTRRGPGGGGQGAAIPPAAEGTDRVKTPHPGAGPPPPAGPGRFPAAPSRTRALTISRPARGCPCDPGRRDRGGRDTRGRARQVRTGAGAAAERWTRGWSAPFPALIGRRSGPLRPDWTALRASASDWLVFRAPPPERGRAVNHRGLPRLGPAPAAPDWTIPKAPPPAC